MSRSKWKGPFIHFNLLRKKYLISRENNSVWCRSSVILSKFIGYKFSIYSGKIFKKLFITREKIGFKFGEFCTTRGKFFHKDQVKRVKKKIFKKT